MGEHEIPGEQKWRLSNLLSQAEYDLATAAAAAMGEILERTVALASPSSYPLKHELDVPGLSGRAPPHYLM